MVLMVLLLEAESLGNKCLISAFLTYAVVVVGEDEAQVAAAVEGANGVPAGSIATGVSLTLIDIYEGTEEK